MWCCAAHSSARSRLALPTASTWAEGMRLSAGSIASRATVPVPSTPRRGYLPRCRFPSLRLRIALINAYHFGVVGGGVGRGLHDGDVAPRGNRCDGQWLPREQMIGKVAMKGIDRHGWQRQVLLRNEAVGGANGHCDSWQCLGGGKLLLDQVAGPLATVHRFVPPVGDDGAFRSQDIPLWLEQRRDI